MSDLLCWNCGESLKDIPRPITRHMYCPGCGEVLHCCRLCRWYSKGRPGDCDHERADPPVEKEGANFCEYFAPGTGAFAAIRNVRKDAAKSRFSSLFGADDAPNDGVDDPPDRRGKDDPVSKLDDLFKD